MPRKVAPPVRTSRRWFSVAAALAITVGFIFGVMSGLGWLGDELRNRLATRDRYRTDFADIECEAPPGLSRETFLTEVRYVANAPDAIHTLDPQLGGTLAAAFAAHPWVESVVAVEPLPPKRVRVVLRFRTPVLAVRLPNGERRWVDGRGIVLTATDRPYELPELAAELHVPPPAGQVWADPTVMRALDFARSESPQFISKTVDGWRLTARDGTVKRIAQ